MTTEFPCVHRGSPQRTVKCMLCSNRGKTVEVFTCALHNECTLRRYKRGQKERDCLLCTDRKPQ